MTWLDRRALLAVIGLTALFWWKLVFSHRFTFLDSPDLMAQVLPWYQMQARAWHAGLFPMWDPYAWLGQPLLGQMQPGAAFPLNWPLFLAPLEEGAINIRWMHLHFGLMHCLAAVFAFLWLRELGRSRYAAVWGGVAFGCAGYVGWVTWPQMLHGAIWLPLTLYFLHRAWRQGWTRGGAASAVLGGGSIGLSLLSGHHQTPFFGLLAWAALVIWFARESLARSRIDAARWFGLAGLTVVIALLVASLQLLPALEYGADAVRWFGAGDPVDSQRVTPYHVHEEGRLRPMSLLGLVIPRAELSVAGLIGWACLSLTLTGVVLSWSERWVRVYTAVALGALLFAFGPLSILHGWIYQLAPLADKARSGFHALYVAQLAMIALAAFGIDRLLTEGSADAAKRWLQRWALMLTAFGVLGFGLIHVLTARGEMDPVAGDRIALSALAAFGAAAILAAWSRRAVGAGVLQFALVALMLAELYPSQRYEVTERDDPHRRQFFGVYEQFAGVAGFLDREQRRLGRPFRFELDFLMPTSYNLGAMYSLEQADGFVASTSRNLYDYLVRHGWTEGRLLFNTVFTVTQEKQRPNQQLVFSDSRTDWKVFRNPSARPRAWLTHSAGNISGLEGAAAGPAADCDPEGEQARVETRSLHRVTVRVEASCDGYLVLADPAAPGWIAKVDGRPSELGVYDGAMRAVAVAAGESLVEFEYRPRAVYVGAALSALGFLICGLAWWGGRRSAPTRA